jgi:glycosyl transferase family 21
VLLEAGPATIGAGRNIGIEAARTTWVALTDAGVTLTPTWLETLWQAASADPGIEVVYGMYEPVIGSFFDRCAALAYVPSVRDVGVGFARGPSVASCLIRKDAWSSIGGFEDSSGAEDMVFLAAIDRSGLKVRWAPAAVVHWSIQPSLRSTFRRFAMYSRATALAGLEDNWHRRVARQYLAAAPFVGLAVTRRRAWLAVPAAGAVARAAKAVWQKRDGNSVAWALNPVQLGTVVAITATADAAMFLGWAQAARQRRRQQPATEAGGQ